MKTLRTSVCSSRRCIAFGWVSREYPADVSLHSDLLLRVKLSFAMQSAWLEAQMPLPHW